MASKKEPTLLSSYINFCKGLYVHTFVHVIDYSVKNISYINKALPYLVGKVPNQVILVTSVEVIQLGEIFGMIHE